jgi:uncharacterized protein DUF6416
MTTFTGEVDVVDERRQWTSGDCEEAEEIWTKLSEDAKAFLRILMEFPDVEFTAAQIGQKLEPSREARNVQGLLGHAGRLCKDAGLEQLWRFPKRDRRTRYSMSRTVGNLLRYADGLRPVTGRQGAQ